MIRSCVRMFDEYLQFSWWNYLEKLVNFLAYFNGKYLQVLKNNEFYLLNIKKKRYTIPMGVLNCMKIILVMGDLFNNIDGDNLLVQFFFFGTLILFSNFPAYKPSHNFCRIFSVGFWTYVYLFIFWFFGALVLSFWLFLTIVSSLLIFNKNYHQLFRTIFDWYFRWQWSFATLQNVTIIFIFF